MFDNKLGRPVLRIPYTSYDIVLWALTILGILAGFLLMLEYWAVMPAIIPIHFGVSGNVDAIGYKYLLAIIPVTAVMVTIVAAILCHNTHRFNLPVPITEKNAEKQYTLARRLILWLNLESIWVCTFLVWNLIDSSAGNFTGRNIYFIPVTAIILCVTIGYYVYKLFITR